MGVDRQSELGCRKGRLSLSRWRMTGVAAVMRLSHRYNFLIFEILAAADAEGDTDVGVMLQWGNVVDQCIPAVPLLVWQMLVFCVMQAVLACHDGGCAKIADEYGW